MFKSTHTNPMQLVTPLQLFPQSDGVLTDELVMSFPGQFPV